MKKIVSKEFSKDIKSLLLESYLGLAYQGGAPSITIQMIADQAQVAFGTVRYHFSQDKERIEFAALEYLLNKANSYLEDSLFSARNTEAFHPLHTYAHFMLEWVDDFPHHAAHLVYYYYLTTTKVKAPLPQEIFINRAYVRIMSLLNESIGLGLYPQIPQKQDCVEQIHSVILGACMRYAIVQDKKLFETILKQLKRQVDSILA